MKICLISGEYPPEGKGGIGTYVYNLARELSRQKHKVTVVTSTKYKEKIYYDHDIRIITIKVPKIRPRDVFYSFKVYLKLRPILNQFDIIEAPETGFEGLFISLFTKKHLVTRMHASSYLISQINNKKIYSYRNTLEEIQTLTSESITAISRSIAGLESEYWDIDPGRIKVIYNGINLNEIKKFKKKNPKLGKYILYFGSLEEMKGIPVLAEIMSHIMEKHKNLKFVFMGKDASYHDTTMKKYIISKNKQFSDRIIFLDYITDNEKKYNHIYHSKLVVLPSIWEGLGYTALEAMALGKVVIATKGSGFSEIISHNKNGLLIAPNNPFELRDTILFALSKNTFNIRKNAVKRAKWFDIKLKAKETVEHYKKVIRK